MNPKERAELLSILARESYVAGEVTLASGKKSDYYLDCRRAIFLPRAAYLAGELMYELAAEAGVRQVGGMAVAAVPVIDAIIGAAYRHNADLRGFFVRKETKQHGLQQLIEGAFRPGLATAVIDDAVTTGGSSVTAVAAMRAANANVTTAIALVDRGEGGAEAFAKAGLKFKSVFTAAEIVAEHAHQSAQR
ncbi:MAG TPA: orotate phosphoribosyltransferase [Candidatus Binataceae bacterium]|nr:orotate phosphoribosyltransferase [Candidatus Binataceae bacterium]